jgi:transposase
MPNDTLLKEKINSFLPNLNERQARLYLASEAIMLGRGGKQKISSIAKVSRVRIDKGILELEEAKGSNLKDQVRKAGGGRKNKKEEYEDLLPELESIVSAYTRGNPMNPLIWTSKSLRQIEKVLIEKGFKISFVTIGELLRTLGYSLQANRKNDEGGKTEYRNEQFEFINAQCIN